MADGKGGLGKNECEEKGEYSVNAGHAVEYAK